MGAGGLAFDVDERVEPRVELLDSVQRGIDQLAGGDLAPADQVGKLGGGAEEEVGEGGFGHDGAAPGFGWPAAYRRTGQPASLRNR
jgi:hypothetical protein